MELAVHFFAWKEMDPKSLEITYKTICLRLSRGLRMNLRVRSVTCWSDMVTSVFDVEGSQQDPPRLLMKLVRLLSSWPVNCEIWLRSNVEVDLLALFVPLTNRELRAKACLDNPRIVKLLALLSNVSQRLWTCSCCGVQTNEQ